MLATPQKASGQYASLAAAHGELTPGALVNDIVQLGLETPAKAGADATPVATPMVAHMAATEAVGNAAAAPLVPVAAMAPAPVPAAASMSPQEAVAVALDDDNDEDFQCAAPAPQPCQ